MLLVALVSSGALAGLAGANDILGVRERFQADWNPDYGFAAFALVYLARRTASGPCFLGAIGGGMARLGSD